MSAPPARVKEGNVGDRSHTQNHLTRVLEILDQAKALAVEYYRLTGRPLGLTGEVAEFEAARILGLELSAVRQSGYDAIRRTPGGDVKLQIKGRCYGLDAKPGQRLGGIRLVREWDAVLMVLLDPEFSATEIWEADRPAIAEALTRPGSVARNERGAMSVGLFKRVGRLVWRRGQGGADR